MKSIILLLFRTIKVLISIAVILMHPITFAENLTVTIVTSSENSAYQHVIDGFKQYLLNEIPEVKFIDFASANKQTPSLVFALGNNAIRQTRDNINNVKIVATMVLNDELLEKVPNARVIPLKIKPFTRLQWHKKILPNITRVGVLYDPTYNQTWIEQATIDAKKLGLELVAVPVNSPKNLTSALKSIGRTADSILSIPDKTVYSSKTARTILLYSFRNRVPFIGLSSAWVKSGALYALEWDYSDLGRQSADIAVKLLRDETVASQLPDKLLYQLNLRTLKQLKRELNKGIIENASMVYQ